MPASPLEEHGPTHQCFGWQGSGNSKFDPEDVKKRLPAVEKMTLEAQKIVEGREASIHETIDSRLRNSLSCQAPASRSKPKFLGASTWGCL
jgi:hypothetical protein